MTEDMICRKVSSMLSQYIDNKVSLSEKQFIEEHISMCPECYKKFIYLKNLISSLKDSYKKVMEMAIQRQKKATFSIREHERFIENLSPYMDNELESTESYEFRKYLMKSKMAQKELKTAYLMQKKLHNSFEKTKRSLEVDFSKEIMADLRSENVYWRRQRFAKVAILAGLMIFGAAELKHYAVPIKNKIEKTFLKKRDVQYVNIPEPLQGSEASVK